jgi:hypothetical protein
VSPAFSEGKAARMVERDATVSVPAGTREALRRELLVLIPRFRTLENLAWDLGDQQAAARIHNIRYRYSTVLKQVQGGFRVISADCSGSGSGTGGRFRHFRCTAQSERALVPVVEVSYDASGLPIVVEREPVAYGPYRATLLVHALGGDAIAYRQLGEATTS